MVTVVVFEFSVMCCQPLRRALCPEQKLLLMGREILLGEGEE
ncbi:acetyltransferase [Vibrio cholerae]|nr:acetyltransferase [Vibrio cholerae]EGR0452350.1 acetyltransferase [Vibrio cholerae]